MIWLMTAQIFLGVFSAAGNRFFMLCFIPYMAERPVLQKTSYKETKP
jgi:hypothetical protein